MSTGRGKLRKQKIVEWIIDKSILVIVAIIIGVALETFAFILKDNFHLSWSWIEVVYFSILSIVIANYESYPLIRKKKKKVILLGLLNGLMALEITLVFLLFYFNLVELPGNKPYLYSFGFVGIGYFTVEIFSAIDEKLSERKRRRGFKDT